MDYYSIIKHFYNGNNRFGYGNFHKPGNVANKQFAHFLTCRGRYSNRYNWNIPSSHLLENFEKYYLTPQSPIITKKNRGI
jgi:hypothetical protein